METLSRNLTGVDKIVYPSSMRPGGATHFFQIWEENVQRIMWRGRWQCQKTLEHYIQESMTSQVLRSVAPLRLRRIDRIAAECSSLLAEVTEALGKK